MAQKDNILLELRELHSSLVNVASQNVYQVPAGYFEGLADHVMRRIKALEAMNASEELGHLSSLLNDNAKETLYTVPAGYFEGLADHLIRRVKALEADSVAEEMKYLSPLLGGISKKMPYTVPPGYFENLGGTSPGLVKTDEENAAEELASLSPLLSGLKKEMPYSVPQDYFENLGNTKNTEVVKPQAKVVSISITKQKWFRYAAAAVVISFVALSGFLIFNKPGSGSSGEKPFAGVIDMKKVSPEEIDQFVQLIDEETPVVASTGIRKETEEIRELIKDIPDAELQQFLDETETSITDETSDDIFMN